MPTSEQQQHVAYYRKALLRKRMLRWAESGACYLPFVGDADLAVDLYADREIFGADLDPARVETARSRLPGADTRVADCDGWPFPDLDVKFALADFDAYADPYASFRAFWASAVKCDRLVLFFTDGHPQGIVRTGYFHHANGSRTVVSGHEKTAAFQFYLVRHIWPWFEDYIKPYRMIHKMRYRRAMMCYWGACLEK